MEFGQPGRGLAAVPAAWTASDRRDVQRLRAGAGAQPAAVRLAARAPARHPRARYPLVRPGRRDRRADDPRGRAGRDPRGGRGGAAHQPASGCAAGWCAPSRRCTPGSWLVEDGGFWYDSDSTNDELPYYMTALDTPFSWCPTPKVHNDVKSPQPRRLRLAAGLLRAPAARPGLPARRGRARAGRAAHVGRGARPVGAASRGRASAVRDFHRVRAGTASVVSFVRRIYVAEFWRRPPTHRGYRHGRGLVRRGTRRGVGASSGAGHPARGRDQEFRRGSR